MKRYLILLVYLSVLIYTVGCASGGHKQEASSALREESSMEVTIDNLEEIHKRYIEPLGLTTAIGQPWAESSEIDSDSVLAIYMMKLLNEQKGEEYYIDYEYVFPADEVEVYTAQYFGMTAEKTRQAAGYDGKTQRYIVPEGLGGAWSICTTGAERKNDLLLVQYDLLSAENQISAHGEMTILIRKDDSHQYLSNSIHGISAEHATSDS